jgi:hypothetical protein
MVLFRAEGTFSLSITSGPVPGIILFSAGKDFKTKSSSHVLPIGSSLLH